MGGQESVLCGAARQARPGGGELLSCGEELGECGPVWSTTAMFATPSSYCVTPSETNFNRLQHRASLILRDVRRRSLRSVKRKRSERNISGKFQHFTFCFKT